jgi:Na+/H+-dicarboxylate symporter
VLWIIGASSVLAFALAAAPGGAVTAALALLAARYGRGLEESYLVVAPVLPLLIAMGVAADVAISGAIAVVAGARARLLVDPRPDRLQR